MSKIVHILIPTTKQRRDRLAKCIDSIHEKAGCPHIISTYENYKEGFVLPCYKLLIDLKPDAMVWCIGDDTVLVEENTISRLVSEYEKNYPNNDGVVQPNDGIQSGRIITMPLCSAKTMLEKGIHLDFFLSYCDDVFTMIMRKEGKYTYCSDIHVEHQHWSVDKAPLDETYEFAKNKLEEDKNAFEKVCKRLGL
jgi:hypothetical protein